MNFCFTIGDYCAGAVTGAATAVAVHAVVGPNTDMVLAMVIGMVLGMIVHLVIGLLLSPLLGLLHLMVPGGLIGMYGGMFFAMRDTMQHASATPSRSLVVGAVFGVVVTAAVRLYDRALHGPLAAVRSR